MYVAPEIIASFDASDLLGEAYGGQNQQGNGSSFNQNNPANQG